MKPTPDDELTRRYREVSERLDEAPSAPARAAILAAAARQVQARPGDAAKPVQRPVRSSSRWPLGAAAAVLLSTLAVLLADRTERESRTELATNEIAPPRVDAAPSVAEKAASPAPSASVSESTKATTTAEARGEIVPPPGGVEEREGRARENRTRRAADAPAEPVAPASTDTRQVPVPATPPRAEAVPPAGSSAQRATAAPQSAVDASSEDSAAGARLRKEERDQAKGQESMSKAAPAAAPALGALGRTSAKAEGSAAAWLERIIELRRKGDESEAAVELKKFRERYPEVVIPPQALPSVGTR